MAFLVAIVLDRSAIHPSPLGVAAQTGGFAASASAQVSSMTARAVLVGGAVGRGVKDASQADGMGRGESSAAWSTPQVAMTLVTGGLAVRPAPQVGSMTAGAVLDGSAIVWSVSGSAQASAMRHRALPATGEIPQGAMAFHAGRLVVLPALESRAVAGGAIGDGLAEAVGMGDPPEHDLVIEADGAVSRLAGADGIFRKLAGNRQQDREAKRKGNRAP